MFERLIIVLKLLLIVKLSIQQTVVWENLDDICYFNRSEVNSINYVKTRCELVTDVQVQKRFFKDYYYWCIAIADGQDVINEDYSKIKNNIVIPVASEFVMYRNHTEHHITNYKWDNYSVTYSKGDHKISVLFSPENKLLSLKIDDIESCDQNRLIEDDPIYSNQKNKNPLKYFEKCVELNSARHSPNPEYCEDLDIVNFNEFILNGQHLFNCITVNKSMDPNQYDEGMLDLILYIGGNYTLRWSNTSNILTTHSNDELFFQVQNTIIISLEPKSEKFEHYIKNILVNNVTNCAPTSRIQICGLAFEQHRHLQNFEYPTFPGQYPWQVAIYKYTENKLEKKHICDGTFIDENVIVTAAHCLIENGTQLAKNRISMSIGKYDLRVSSYYAKELNDVSSILLHPDFNMETRENDIGLVLTKTRFESNEYVARLCFESNNDALFTHFYGIVPSWASTCESEYQDLLSEAKIIFDTNNSCDSVYSSTELCGRYDFEGTSACAKDGGGLVVNFGPTRFLRGIVTIRHSENDECKSGEPVIFADIQKYAKWIKSKYYRKYY